LKKKKESSENGEFGPFSSRKNLCVDVKIMFLGRNLAKILPVKEMLGHLGFKMFKYVQGETSEECIKMRFQSVFGQLLLFKNNHVVGYFLEFLWDHTYYQFQYLKMVPGYQNILSNNHWLYIMIGYQITY
jgi:hypothetical protein